MIEQQSIGRLSRCTIWPLVLWPLIRRRIDGVSLETTTLSISVKALGVVHGKEGCLDTLACKYSSKKATLTCSYS